MLSLIGGIYSLGYIITHAPFFVFTGMAEVIVTEPGCYDFSTYDAYFCLKYFGDVYPNPSANTLSATIICKLSKKNLINK